MSDPSSNEFVLIEEQVVSTVEILDEGVVTPAREMLSANRTYYVRPDGHDTASGLNDSNDAVTGAFLTNQAAFNKIATLDFNGKTVTVQTKDGTYSEAVSIPVTVGQTGVSNLVWQGNAVTPTNVVLTQSNPYGITVYIPKGAALTLKNLKIASPVGHSIKNDGVLAYSGIDFGAAANHHIFSEGGFTSCVGNYTISGGAMSHFAPQTPGAMLKVQNKTITASASVNFSIAFIYADGPCQAVCSGCTFAGTFTGKRYSVTNNAVIQTYGGGANCFPGSVAGTATTGGQYS